MFAIEGSEAPCTDSLCPLLSTFPFAAFSFPNIVGIPQLPVAGGFPIIQIAKCEQKEKILFLELSLNHKMWALVIGLHFGMCSYLEEQISLAAQLDPSHSAIINTGEGHEQNGSQREGAKHNDHFTVTQMREYIYWERTFTGIHIPFSANQAWARLLSRFWPVFPGFKDLPFSHWAFQWLFSLYDLSW